MTTLRTSKFCWSCKRTTTFVRLQPNNTIHVILSLLTVGFWLPFWGAIALYNHSRIGWRCEECGTKYEKT